MLASAADSRTVFEDWLVRRQRLAASETIPEPHRRIQLQVLEYLLRHYADSPEAARPARHSATADFYSNDRLIVVHQHLGRGQIAGVKSKAEANRRVGDILSHLRRVHEGTENIAAHNDFVTWIDGLEQQSEPLVNAWRSVWRQMTSGSRTATSVLKSIAASLEQSPYLPRAALAYLCRVLSQTRFGDRAAELLLKCRSESVPEYAARAWRDRVEAGWRLDRATQILDRYLIGEPRALDAVRERLADESPAVRLAAARILGAAGTLDDVALLSDLVSLPRTADEDPGERKALLDAMWAIAHRD